MSSQKGIGLIAIIIGVFLILILGTAGAGAMILTGQSPVCPNQGGSARSEQVIGDILKTGPVTMTDSEATTLAQSYIGRQVEDARVCFTEELGHISGKIKLGPVSPSFYASGGVDLTGSKPVLTNFGIQLGSLPNIPLISSLAQSTVNNLISENLAKFELKQKYSAAFTRGSVTISK